MPQKKQKKVQKRNTRQVVISAPAERSLLKEYSLPASVGSTAYGRRIEFSQIPPGALCDTDPIGGVRITGFSQLYTCTFGITGYGVIQTSAGSNGNPWVTLEPSTFSNTLSLAFNMFDVFSRYRFVKLRQHYVPMVPTSTTGVVAIGFDQTQFRPSTNFIEIGQTPLSVSSPVYMPASTPWYINKGPKTYDTAESDDLNDQVVVTGATAGPLISGTGSTFGAGTQFGIVFLEYTIDFFGPRSNAGSPSIFLNRFSDSLKPEERDKVAPLLDELCSQLSISPKKSRAQVNQYCAATASSASSEVPDTSWTSVQNRESSISSRAVPGPKRL